MRGYRGGIIFVFLCRHFQQEAVNANLGYRYKQSFVGFVEVDGWFFFFMQTSPLGVAPVLQGVRT